MSHFKTYSFTAYWWVISVIGAHVLSADSLLGKVKGLENTIRCDATLYIFIYQIPYVEIRYSWQANTMIHCNDLLRYDMRMEMIEIMIGCDMLRWDSMWCSTIRCLWQTNTGRYGVEWYDTMWCNSIRYDMLRLHTMQCSMIFADGDYNIINAMRFNKIRYDLILYNTLWCNVILYIYITHYTLHSLNDTRYALYTFPLIPIITQWQLYKRVAFV